MDCSYVITFSRPNHWTSKCHCKALDVVINQRLIPSVSVFKEFDCKVKTFLYCLALVQSYQEQFKQLKQLSASVGLESYAFYEISSSIVPAIAHFVRFLALVRAVNSDTS